jgi:MoxR-like ATPase
MKLPEPRPPETSTAPVALHLPPAGPAQAGEALAVRAQILAEVGKVYIGAADTIDLLLVALLARGHVLLEGVPGIAKTTLVKTFSRTLGCRFSRIQFTPDLLPADITGTYVLNMRESTFTLRKGPVFANLVLGDEINRAPAKTQSALLEAMAESQVTIEGETLLLPQPFMVLATQNPVEQEGVYLLPEAQVDRFLFKVVLGYPSFEDERRVLQTYDRPLAEVETVVSPEAILELAGRAMEVHLAPELLDYTVRLVQKTRRHPSVLLGASPRASLNLMRGAKAHAFIQGRTHVLPDDVRVLAHAVLDHRILLQPEAELDQVEIREVVDQCLLEVPYADAV